MKKSLAYSLIAILAVLVIVFAVIHFTNNADKTKQIDTLNANVADKAGQIETLTADVDDKAGQIETLTTNVTERDAQIKTLNADVADKAGQIETLTADVAEKAGQIEALTTNVTERDAQITTLNADVADKAGQIETLTADVADKAEQIETLTTNVTERDTQIKALNADVADKAGQIETLSADVAERDGKIKALNEDVAGKTKEIETLNATVKEKDSQIETLTADVADKASQIEALTADISDKSAQIETLTSENKKKDDQIELLKEMVSGSSASSTSLETGNPLVTAPTEEFVIERLSTVPDIAKIAAATEDNDPNGQLGKQGGYTAQIYFSSPLVNPTYANKPDLDVIEAGTSCGGSIEVYSTVADAEKRERYLASFDGGAMSSGSHTVVGTILIRTSSKLSASDQKKLEAEIIEALTAENLPKKETSPQSTSESDQSSSTESITVKEAGFQIKNGYLYYSFIAHNNMKEFAAYLPEFSITTRDSSGGLISADSQILMVLYPDQDVAFAGLSRSVDEIPSSIEIEFVEPDDDWHIVKPSKLEHPEYIPLEVKNPKLKEGKFDYTIVGEIYNPNSYNIGQVAVTVVFRDKDGKLLAGNTTFVNGAKGGKTIAFEMNVNKEIATDSFEVYAQPW